MKIRVFSSLLGSVLLMLVLAACGGTTLSTGPSRGANQAALPGIPTMTPGSDPMTNSLKGLSGKDFEVKFMQYMIVHHQSAIKMAQLVPTHTKRAELITLAQNIILAQKIEIGQMTTWLSQWYNEKPVANPMSVPGMMSMMSEMNTLKHAKDAAFDKQFLALMIVHHQQAINMAKLVPGKTHRPELIQLSQDIVRTQSAEIQQMQSWQKEWFKA